MLLEHIKLPKKREQGRCSGTTCEKNGLAANWCWTFQEDAASPAAQDEHRGR